MPATGSWQNWKSVNTRVNLDKGTTQIRFFISQNGINLNYFKFDLQSGTESTIFDNNKIKIYPNPSKYSAQVEIEDEHNSHNIIEVYETSGKLVSQDLFEGKYYTILNNKIGQGMFLVVVKNDFSIYRVPYLVN